MDELEISGKRYISTRRAAKEHGYHSDYMGQLIRGKKVVGQKVGRAWYIEEQSLAAYLGKELQPVQREQQVQPEQPAHKEPESVPAPVERLIAEVQAPAAAPQPHIVAPAVPEHSQPVAEEIIKEEAAQPTEARVAPQAEPRHEPLAQPPAREIHHVPHMEERETFIPVHTQAPRAQEAGGLRYAADDTPLMPVVTRAPQPLPQMAAQYDYAQPARTGGKFPYISLSLVAVVTLAAAAFASNFVTATVVTEQGKAATVQYAIHW